MKPKAVLAAILSLGLSLAYAQATKSAGSKTGKTAASAAGDLPGPRVDGLYVHEVNGNAECFRFYPDGMVSFDRVAPQALVKLYERVGLEQALETGQYILRDSAIRIPLTNRWGRGGHWYDGTLESGALKVAYYPALIGSPNPVLEFAFRTEEQLRARSAAQPAPPAATPPGAADRRDPISHVRWGTSEVVRDPSDKGRNCTLKDPLPTGGKIPKGSTQLAHEFEIDPARTTISSMRLMGMGVEKVALQASCCNDLVIIDSKPRARRIACTVKRSDGEAFKSGQYRLVVFDNSGISELPLTVE